MGAVASAVSSAVSSVVESVGDAVESVGQAVGEAAESVGNAVGEAAEEIGNAIGEGAEAVGDFGEHVDKVVDKHVPGGWMTVGLVAGTIATAGALGAGSFGTFGAGTASQAASAASAATTFAGASSSTVASVATGVLQSAATGALKGAAVGGIRAALEGDDIWDGVVSGAGSGALGGAIGGVNQLLPFNPYVEQAMGNVVKSAAMGNLDKSLDKILFNAAAGYAGDQLGISPSVAVPAANLARAAAEGKDLSKALQNTAINYAAGQAGKELGKYAGDFIGDPMGSVKEALGMTNSENKLAEEPKELSSSDRLLKFAEQAVKTSVGDYLQDYAKEQLQPKRPTPQPRTPRTGSSAQELMAQGYSWDPERQVWRRPATSSQAAQETPQPGGTSPMSPQQLAEMGYIWDEERGAYKRPKPVEKALEEYKDPYESLFSAPEMPKQLTLQEQLAQMGFSFDPEQKTLMATPSSPEQKPPSSASSISPFADTFNLTDQNTDFAIDRALGEYNDPYGSDAVLGEYVDPYLNPDAKRRVIPRTNIFAGGAPLQTGSGLYAGTGFTGFSGGGSTSSKSKNTVDYTDGFIDKTTEGIFRYIRPGVMRGNTDYTMPGYPFGQLYRLGMAEGGSTNTEHNPEFFSEGGLNTLDNTYVNGKGDGTSDSIPAMLANGEFVIPADVVSSLGNGSNDSGAKVLDEFLKTIRTHKRKADPKKLPPDSKGALGYLLEAKKQAKK
jgi:hypothetical protein